MIIKVQNRQRQTFTVHEVSEEAFMCSPPPTPHRPPEASNKADPSDLVTVRTVPCSQGPFPPQITADGKSNDTTRNLHHFKRL